MVEGLFATIISILAASLRMAVPIGFASIGGAYSEKSGIIALGLEGFMAIGAFAAVIGAHLFQSAIIGLLFSIVAGGLISSLYAFLSIRYKANQTVCGLGLNIIAQALISALMVVIFGNKGKSCFVPSLQPISLPLISKTPVLKELFSGHTILFYLLIIITICSWILFYKTPWGMRMRSTGTNPEVIIALGLSSKKIQYVSQFICGALCGLGGAYLSIGQLNFYSLDMVAGRGFIAIAVFVFANWNPILCILVSLLFGCMMAIQMRLQTYGMPSQLIQMIPYICTLLVLFNTRRREKSYS